MAKEEKAIEFDGVVTEVLSNGNFRVQISEDYELLAYLSGKMRKFRIRIVLGDRVTVAVTPYDARRGRITYRMK